MGEYRFLTTWRIDAPLDAVWDVVYRVEDWPAWWRGVELVEPIRTGDESGLGSVHRHRWRSLLPYSVSFEIETTRIEPLRLLEGRARGGLEGIGRWRFYADEATVITYEWNVRTTRRWMRLVEPVGRPVFAASHNLVMRWGGEGLARRLGARLIARN